VRFSKEKVSSPIIGEGGADILMEFELLEAVRSLKFLKRHGALVANTQKISPMPVISGQAQYPQDLLDKLKVSEIELKTVDALSLAISAGSPKATNVVLIGLLASSMDFGKEAWLDALTSIVPKKLLDVNLKAFELGFASA
jgi:indolepyruvate ferredoxin oxidoreductase beta subunit